MNLEFLTDIKLSLLLVFSFAIIISAIMMVIHGNYWVRDFGIIIIILYAIVICTGGSFFLSKFFGLGVPIGIFIFILAIFLIILATQPRITPQLEHLSYNDNNGQAAWGIGPSINIKNQWCNMIGGKCVDDEGTYYPKNKIVGEKRKYHRAQESCQAAKIDLKECQVEMQEAREKIETEKGDISISTGICLTPDNQWGIIIPEYGRKCIPFDTYKKYFKPKKIKPIKPIIKPAIPIKPKKYPPPGYLHYPTQCMPPNTNFNKLCHQLFGPDVGVKNIYDCHESYCKDANFKQAECAPGYDNGHKVGKDVTDCHPITDDFNFWCQYAYGRNYGYERIIPGKEAGCYVNNKPAPGMARAKCSSLYYDGIPKYGISKKLTDCAPWDSNFDELCKKKYGRASYYKEKGGYNCKPGYGRGLCL